MADSNKSTAWAPPNPAELNPHRRGCNTSTRAMDGPTAGCPGCYAAIEAKTQAALRRTGGNATVHTDACHTRVDRQWNGDYRNLHRSPTPGCQGCDTGRKGRRK